MPRLLLVDDNPSIHKIAETLLASSSIELVCVDSAAGALEKLNHGEHFDVALVDTFMAGMDGWELLDWLRKNASTARMPIAMMAGVLDVVDPERVRNAPIQGFLKKPAELRDLKERVVKLMEVSMDMPSSPAWETSPFVTMPGTSLMNLPELRKAVGPTSTPASNSAPDQGTGQGPELEDDILDLTEEDLYPEVAPEAPAKGLMGRPEDTLDLEELDLDSLRGLTVEPVAHASSAPPPIKPQEEIETLVELTSPSGFVPSDLDGVLDVGVLDVAQAIPMSEVPAAQGNARAVEAELPDLGPMGEDVLDAHTLGGIPEFQDAIFSAGDQELVIPLSELISESGQDASLMPGSVSLGPPLDWADESEGMLVMAEPLEPQSETFLLETLSDEELVLSTPQHALLEESPLEIDEDSLVLPAEEVMKTPVAIESAELELAVEDMEAEMVPPPVPPRVDVVPPEQMPLPDTLVVEPDDSMPEAATEPWTPPTGTAPPVIGLTPREVIEAAMADPALMDALARAVVAKLGDQVLREIAWEIMPELADRIPHS